MIRRAVAHLKRNTALRLIFSIFGGVSMGHGAARLYLTSGQEGTPFLAVGILLTLIAFSPYIFYRKSNA